MKYVSDMTPAELAAAVESAFREIDHATYNQGWFTDGASGASKHRLMWLRRGAEAARTLRPFVVYAQELETWRRLPWYRRVFTKMPKEIDK